MKYLLITMAVCLASSAQAQTRQADPLSGSVTLCANVANPLTGKFLRQAYIPVEEVAARNISNGFGGSRIARGPCQTQVIATSPTHMIVTTFSTITGKMLSDVLSERPVIIE